MPDLISLDETVAELREIVVAIYTPGGSPVNGIDETDVTIKTSKPGEDLAASAATLTQIAGYSSGGLYRLRFTASEVDTLGDVALEISSGTTTIQAVIGYVTIIQTLDATDAGIASSLVQSGTARGGSISSIQLALDASSTNDTYTRSLATIVDGTGAGQTRKIESYIGSTRTATLERDWAVAPDNTSKYQILGADQQPGPDSHMEAGITYGDGHRLLVRDAVAKSVKDGNDYVKRDLADTKDSHSGTVTASGRIAATIIDPT